MGLFSKKVKDEKMELAETLPRTKKVQFIDKPISEVKGALDANINNILTFEPANYYANKASYLLCAFYFEEDYSKIVMGVQIFVNDKPKSDELLYFADYNLMKQVLRKFGLNI